MLRIVEIFNSIQGEASHAGVACAFVRLARCNLRCGYCDTPYSFGAGEPWEETAVVEHVENFGVTHVCITGGEPMLQNDEVCSLMQRFVDLGYTVLLETNGVIPLNDVPAPVIKIMDIKTPDGLEMKSNDEKFLKKHLHYPNLDLLNPHDELKIVIVSRADYEWARHFIKKHQLFDKVEHVFLSPSWSDISPDELSKWILEDKLPVRLNLQLHKYIWGADAQGV